MLECLEMGENGGRTDRSEGPSTEQVESKVEAEEEEDDVE